MSSSIKFKPKVYGQAKLNCVCLGLASIIVFCMGLLENKLWFFTLIIAVPLFLLSLYLLRRITQNASPLTINKDGIYYEAIEKAHGVKFIPWSAVSRFKHFNFANLNLLYDEDGDIVGSVRSADRANYIVIYFNDSEFKEKIKCSFCHRLIHGKSVIIDLNWLECKSSDVKNAINIRYIDYLEKEAKKKKRALAA